MVIHEQAQQLIARWIEPHPWKRDVAEARLTDSKIAVWAIIGQLGGEHGDMQRMAEEYNIYPEAVDAALAYYGEHRAEIDERLAANAA